MKAEEIISKRKIIYKFFNEVIDLSYIPGDEFECRKGFLDMQMKEIHYYIFRDFYLFNMHIEDIAEGVLNYDEFIDILIKEGLIIKKEVDYYDEDLGQIDIVYELTDKSKEKIRLIAFYNDFIDDVSL